MTDVEVKRKELETAKRIRGNGYTCLHAEPAISCTPDDCPSRNDGGFCLMWDPAGWDAFISTREAELAQPEQSEVSRSGLAEALELSLAMYFRDPSVEEAKALNVIAARLQRDIDAERERQERILTGRA